MLPSSLTKKAYLALTAVVTISMLILGYINAIDIKKYVYAKKERTLLEIATTLEQKLPKSYNEILTEESALALSEDEKAKVLNKRLQPIINEVANLFPGYSMGYGSYSRIIASNPFALGPTSQNDKDAYINRATQISIVKPTPLGDSTASLTAFYPLTYNDEMYGHIWVSTKYEDIQLAFLLAYGSSLIIFCGAWLVIILAIVGTFRNIERSLGKLAIQISNQDVTPPGLKQFPELEPVVETITELKQSLTDEKQKVVDIFDSVSDGFYSLDKEFRIIYYNRKVTEYGFINQEHLNRSLLEIFPETRGGQLHHALLYAMTENKPVSILGEKSTYMDKWFDIRVFPSRRGATVIFQDVTESKALTEQLKQAHNEIKQILGRITDGFYALDSNLVFTYMNNEAKKLFNQQDFTGKYLWDVLPKIPPFVDMYTKSIEQQIAVHFEGYSPAVKKWLEVSVYPSKDGLSVFFRDITERKLSEKEEAEQNQLLREQMRLLDLEPDCTIIRNLNDQIIFFNKKGEELYGYKAEELTGKVTHDLFKTEYPEPLASIEAKLYKTGKWEGELIHEAVDGSKKIIKSCWLLRRGMDNLPESILEINQDITAQKEMQRHLARLDELHVVSKIAASISHEVRNPMTTVRGFLQYLSVKQGCEAYKSYFDLMIEELDRANAIIAEFLSVARVKAEDKEVLNLNDIINIVSPLLEADALKNGHEIKLALDNIPNLLLSSKEIRQMILNFTRNAFEAMIQHGKVIIQTYRDEGNITLAIQDNGPGIDKSIVEKLGTPFVTTKEGGTGLGLAVCYGIAQRHGAVIDVNTGESGTTFFVKFPLGRFLT